MANVFINCQLYRKDENKEKEAGNGPFKKLFYKSMSSWAVVVAQLAARSLPIPEYPGSNPIKTKINKKRPGMVPF